MQSEIAAEVAHKLRAILIGDSVSQWKWVEQKTITLDAYILGVRRKVRIHKQEDLDTVVAELSESIRLDDAKYHSLKAAESVDRSGWRPRARSTTASILGFDGGSFEITARSPKSSRRGCDTQGS